MLQFQNLVIGMRKIHQQLIAIPTFSTECEKRGTLVRLLWDLARILNHHTPTHRSKKMLVTALWYIYQSIIVLTQVHGFIRFLVLFFFQYLLYLLNLSFSCFLLFSRFAAFHGVENEGFCFYFTDII